MLPQSLLVGLRPFVWPLLFFSLWFVGFDVPLLVVASLFVSTNSDSVRLRGLGVDCLGLVLYVLFVASLSV